jgi:hypothetical protein
MPFRNSDLPTLPNSPTVKVFLQGQLILEPARDGSKCDVGINRCTPDHHFSIEVRQRMINSQRPDVILMRHLGTLEGLGIEIDLVPASINGVRKFVPTEEFKRDAKLPDDSPEAQDLRWMVDLANEEFHNAELIVNGNGTSPNIQIKDGLFYSAMRTDENLSVTRTGGGEGTAELELHRVASIVGVNIYGDKVILRFTNNGKNEKLELAKTRDSFYEIRVINDPPFIDPKLDPSTLPTHRELKEYYKVIDALVVPDPEEPGEVKEITDFPRFELRLKKNDMPNLGSPTIPCMPVGSGTAG